MSLASNPGAAPAASFDPTLWLGALVSIGGGYALAAERKLWLVVNDCPAHALAPVMAQIIGQPERVEAVRATIERRQLEEALS